jgi:hypothetical protein
LVERNPKGETKVPRSSLLHCRYELTNLAIDLVNPGAETRIIAQ